MEGKMNKVISMIVLCFFLGNATAFADPAKNSENLAATINYLLSFVEKSECTFFRNNKAHTAKKAVRHMRNKYAHFRDDIETPEDFIRLSASKSLISGRPYMVKTKAGQMMKSETWLLEALEAYRQKQHKKKESDGVSQ
jgi:hypothetical protein